PRRRPRRRRPPQLPRHVPTTAATEGGSSGINERHDSAGRRRPARAGETPALRYNPRVSVPLFFALYCLEAGLFFIFVPWTRVWTMNPLLQSPLTVAMLAGNPFVRGFVSGFGVVHIILGIKDIVRISAARRAGRAE